MHAIGDERGVADPALAAVAGDRDVDLVAAVLVTVTVAGLLPV